MEEAANSDPFSYACFNEFFTRALRPAARPIDPDEAVVLSPADGVVSQLGQIDCGRLVQAKGRDFSLQALLGGDDKRAEPFQGGVFATVYLSPKDYHRVHMPIAGILREMIHIPGKLFSVNQVTSDSVADLFARNERVVCLFDTEHGPMALVLVGAMIVASVDTVWSGEVCPAGKVPCKTDYTEHSPPVQIARGAEMGRFKLGSTVVAVYGPGMVNLDKSIAAGEPVKVGTALGRLNSCS